MNKQGQMVMINLLVLTMTIAIMIAIIPMLNSLLNTTKQSDNLNCPGYTNTADNSLSYNSSLNNTDTIACIAITLYVPYIVLAILIGGVTKLLTRPYEGQYGGSQYGGRY